MNPSRRTFVRNASLAGLAISMGPIPAWAVPGLRMEQDEDPDPHPGRRPRGHLGLRADGPCAGAAGDDGGESQKMTSSPRKRGPIATADVIGEGVYLIVQSIGHGVWVPAFQPSLKLRRTGTEARRSLWRRRVAGTTPAERVA